MKQFGTILNFELKEYLKNKAYIITTVVMVALLAVVMFIPTLLSNIDFGSSSSKPKPALVSVSDTMPSSIKKELEDTITTVFPGNEFTFTTDSSDKIKEQIENGDVEFAFVFGDNISQYTYYVNDLKMTDNNTSILDDSLNELIHTHAFEKNGISAAEARRIMSTRVSSTTENLGQNQAQNFFYTYAMIMALYMVIAMYGQMIASHVAAEKDSRVMELLIATASPTSMMFAKVIASCLAGLLQLTVIFGSSILFFHLSSMSSSMSVIFASFFDIPVHLLVYMLVFFLLGYLIYAFLFGAVGSTVSRIEDLSTAIAPLTMVFVGAFMIVIFSMSSGEVNNGLMVFASYFPLSSPMAMFTRIAMSNVPAYEIAISIGILLVSVWLFGKLAAKIYRTGVLLYGTKPKLSTLIKQVIKA